MTSSSPITIGSDDDCPYISGSSSSSKEINLSHLPPVFVLPTRLADVTLHSLEQSLLSYNAPLTYNLSEAVLFIADINTARRCEVELRGKGVWTERIERDLEQVREDTDNVDRKAQGLQREEVIKVVKIKWLTDLLESGKDVGMEKYVVYVGRKVPPPPPPPLSSTSGVEDGEPVKKKIKLEEGDDSKHIQDPKSLGAGILERAKLDAQEAPKAKRKAGGHHYHRGTGLGGSRYGRSNRHGPADGGETAKISHQAPAGGIPSLSRKSTQEWENEQELSRTRPMPEWIKKKLKYSCERTTPLKTPNDHFISLLQVIKLSRTLSLDPIGIRAYSTAIASIAAYPYPLLSSAEVSQLPGCDGKIAGLFHEYIHSTPAPPSQPDLSRTLQVVQDLEASEEFTILRTFWKIWGVGVVTAREFYFEKGWRDLDDVVEFGWSGLSRVQQIGVKYYDEFNNIRISRDEVERIANLIITAARTVGGKEWDGLVCGGYRRGKDWSGDVDIVLSHPDESLFENNPGGKGGAAVEWVSRIVSELETGGWVTHTLYLGRGGGFGSQKIDPTTNIFTHSTTLHDKDTLSKAMIVWQEQETPHPDYLQWPGEGIKNPYPHRRVDIIVAPSSTAATAILGWTGATTFERDLRRFVEREYGWKFDSGGVWDRRTGERIDGLGGWKRGETLEESEKRLLEGLGVGWKEPWLRNTG